MAIRYLDSVIVYGVEKEILLALQVAEGVFSDYGYDCIVTSLKDGKHGPNSLHYVGAAVDLRSKHLKLSDVNRVFSALKERLPLGFDCVNELSPAHFHIEYQPKFGES